MAFSVITGILAVAKSSIFSDWNNAIVRTLLNKQIAGYFGFTQ